VPAVLSRVLVTVGIQYMTLPVHLFQPVNFKNELDLTPKSIRRVGKDAIGSIHLCFLRVPLIAITGSFRR